jgi:hypothetical protein
MKLSSPSQGQQGNVVHPSLALVLSHSNRISVKGGRGLNGHLVASNQAGLIDTGRQPPGGLRISKESRNIHAQVNNHIASSHRMLLERCDNMLL